METSRHSDGIKSDKGTQSPMLRIFKDIIQKDVDPEKAKLLKEKHRRAKDRVLPQSSIMAEQRVYDSNNTDKLKESKQSPEMNNDSSRYNYQKRNGPMQPEVKTSNWFGQNMCDKKEKKMSSDTCSCVSCALKNILGSERTCIICLILIFLLSVTAGLLVVFNALPATDSGPICIDDSMSNKIQKSKEKRQLRDVYNKDYTDRPYWEKLPGDRFDLPTLMTRDINKIRGTNLLGDLISDDITNILNTDEIMNSRNERLRDFYKRLLETDAQIKKVKEIIFDNSKNSNNKLLGDRFKRSFERKQKNFPKTGLLKDSHKSIINISDKVRHKRLPRESNITGFIIQEEKFYVKYQPLKNRKYPGYSHNHKVSHGENTKHSLHEQNKKNDGVSKQTLQPAISDNKKVNNIKSKNSFVDSTGQYESSGYNFDWSDKIAPVVESDVALNITKSDDKNNEEVTRHSRSIHRKLLQVFTEEDKRKDEDVKEVLNDLKNTIDIKKENQKANDGFKYSFELPVQNPQPDLPKLYNSDWKNSLPLNPEELNSIIQEAAIKNLNMEIPDDTKDRQPEMENEVIDLNDVQYIEDYSDNKYNKIMKVAQAYSDYGVLTDKKEAMADKDRISSDKKAKSLLESKFVKDNIDRLRKGIDCSKTQKIMKTLHKHIKFINDSSQCQSDALIHQKNLNKNLFKAKETTTEARVEKHVYEKRYGRSLKSIKEYPTLIEDYDTINGNEKYKRKPNERISNSHNKSITSMFNFLSSMKNWFRTRSSVPVHVEPKIARNITYGSLRYRSRNLMEYKNNNTKQYLEVTNNLSTINSSTSQKLKIETANKGPGDNILPVILTMISKNKDSIIPYSKESNINTKNETGTEHTKTKENKTVVKRNVDDEFVFWNDLYDDDEYGVKLDYLDEKRKGNKHDIKKSRIQKSKDWIKDKVFLLKSRNDNSKFSSTIDLNDFSTTKSSVEETLKKIAKKRKTRNLEFDEEKGMEDIFKDMTANMKKVCREAANAIQNTRNVKVRESKEELATSNLMQRLVRLMSDLVDIQVQEKTCAKLPSDLRQFLEWLIAPSEENTKADHLSLDKSEYTANEEYGGGRFEKSSDKTLEFPSLTEDTHQDDRTECLGTIRAVQDLVEEYEGLSNEDKSKMAGVKEYLQRQLEYLNKLAPVDNSNIYEEFEKYEARGKRELNQMRHKDEFTKNRKNKIFLEFVKEPRQRNAKPATYVYTETTDISLKDAEENTKSQKQRNLNDVYYRALEEARKTTNEPPKTQ